MLIRPSQTLPSGRSANQKCVAFKSAEKDMPGFILVGFRQLKNSEIDFLSKRTMIINYQTMYVIFSHTSEQKKKPCGPQWV